MPEKTLCDQLAQSVLLFMPPHESRQTWAYKGVKGQDLPIGNENMYHYLSSHTADKRWLE